MPGKGKLQLTGQLGDVMKESAHAAFSYVRSHAAKLNLDANFHDEIDIHIHIPEGAIPKDGPSAGIALATALLSAVSKRAVRSSLAMTGEITLRGRVLPIGGLKRKVLAALRQGIKTVLFPRGNEKDLQEIPDYVQKRIELVPVGHLDEVLKLPLLTVRKIRLPVSHAAYKEWLQREALSAAHPKISRPEEIRPKHRETGFGPLKWLTGLAKSTRAGWVLTMPLSTLVNYRKNTKYGGLRRF